MISSDNRETGLHSNAVFIFRGILGAFHFTTTKILCAKYCFTLKAEIVIIISHQAAVNLHHISIKGSDSSIVMYLVL